MQSLSNGASSSIFIPPGSRESIGIEEDCYVEEYRHWHLTLQPEDRRERRGLAAGLIIAKREIALLIDLKPEEWAEINTIVKTGPQKLCEKAGVTFTGHFRGPAFTNGELAGQSQAQVHGHIYPIVEEQLPAEGERFGIGAMTEAAVEKYQT